MNVLSVYCSHTGAISISKDNELLVHIEISRINRFKNVPWPDSYLIKKINELNVPFDHILLTHLDDHCTDMWLYIINQKKLIIKNNCLIHITKEHHIFHASCAKLFNNRTDYLVWDGSGLNYDFDDHFADEQTSYFKNNLNNSFKLLHTNHGTDYVKDNIHVSPHNIGIGQVYQILTRELGLFLKDQFSEGKAMALSSFGKMNIDYYNKIIFQNHFNKNYIIANHSKNINTKKIFSGNFNTDIDNKDAQDLAFTFQKACEFMAIQFIKKLKINNDITISGGVGQNILINSILSKEFNFNIYVDPICDDQGISLGRLNHFLNFKLEKEKGVYLGFKPKYELEIFNNNFKINDCSIKEAAKVVNSFPMAIFQGRSEQGQRALGNRSLLMNATHPECISLINKIKKREWYRPFACSILYEEISNWFINNIKQDPEYMMFVYTAKEDKLTFLKNVTAKDNTSRIQGVKSTTNKNYYDLLKMYNEEYKIPFLLNTSLNQPGEPIVETLYDLKNMMLNTSLNYAYLPEIKKIIIKIKDE